MLATDYSPKSDECLMQDIKNGHTAAFDELYGRYSTRLLHFFYRMFDKDNEKAEDFLQDLFLKIIEKPHLFDADKRFSTWVYAIANNMCRNEYRRLAIRTNGQNQVDEVLYNGNKICPPDIENRIDSTLFLQMLREEIEHLDEIKKSTFLLRYQENFSLKEIAEIMQCSEGTVKSRLFYTTQKLADKLKIFAPSK